MTRVLFVAHTVYPSGSTIALQRLVSNLTGYGIQAVIAYPAFSDPGYTKSFVDSFQKMGCTCVSCFMSPLYVKKHQLRGIRGYAYRRLLSVKQFVGYKELLKLVKKTKPDLIHTNTGVVQEGMKAANALGIPHVWHIREYQTLGLNWELYPSERKVKELFRSSHTICITEDIQKFFDLYGSPKSRVIYDPLFSMNNLGANNHSRQAYFFIANRLSPQKGTESLLKAFSIFSSENPEYELLIAGSGDKKYIDHLKSLCQALNIANRVVFKGFVKDVSSLMQQARALLVGSYFEGFGMMTAEANMQGCIVIGRNSAGTKEILEKTRGGFLFNDESELVAYMKQVAEMSDEKLKQYMEQPMRTARSLFSQEVSSQQVFSYYQTILGEKQRG